CFEPQRTFMADKWAVTSWFRHNQGADGWKLWFITDECIGAGAAGFLARGDDQYDAGRRNKPVSQSNTSGNKRSHTAFHIGRSAAIEFSVNDRAAQRFNQPGLRAKWHGIEVAGKADRQFVTCTADAGDDLRAAFAKWAKFNCKTRTLKN